MSKEILVILYLLNLWILSTSANVAGYHKQRNRDVDGWTLSQYPALSLEECAQKCNLLSQCTGFTYVTNFKAYGDHFAIRYNCFAKSGLKTKKKRGATFYINERRTRIMRREGVKPRYRPRVKCLSDSVKVVVDMTNLPKQDRKIYKLHAGSNPLRNTCRSFAHGNLRILKFLLVDCSPLITETENELVYTYSIGANTYNEDYNFKRRKRSLNDSHTNLQRSRRAITRSHMFRVEVSCRYKRNSIMSSKYVGNIYTVKYRGSAASNFKFSMAVYKNAKFSQTYRKGARIAVGTTVYPRIDFLSHADVNMYVRDCYAVPKNGGIYNWVFVKPGGCIGQDKSFKTVQATSKAYGFKFDVFRFKGLKSVELMLKCDVFLCKKEFSGKGHCKHPHMCFKQKRGLGNPSAYAVEVGPFHIV